MSVIIYYLYLLATNKFGAQINEIAPWLFVSTIQFSKQINVHSFRSCRIVEAIAVVVVVVVVVAIVIVVIVVAIVIVVLAVEIVSSNSSSNCQQS